MNNILYVVYRYSDNRKENDSSIIAVCKTEETALRTMQDAIQRYTEGKDCDIEVFDNGANVICGGDYEVFCIDTTILLD
jgi:hypothetical protein